MPETPHTTSGPQATGVRAETGLLDPETPALARARHRARQARSSAAVRLRNPSYVLAGEHAPAGASCSACGTRLL